MKRLKAYLNLYKNFVATSAAIETSFRSSFILIIVMEIIFYFTTLGSVTFIYDHVSTIGPWNKDQLLFFISYCLLLNNMHMVFISENFWEFSFLIRTGELDFVLLRPKSTLFSVFFRYFRLSGSMIFPLSIGLLIYYGQKIPLTAWDWVFVPVILILSFLLNIILEMIISVSNFWLTEGVGINFLRMQFQTISRWPAFIYEFFTQKLFSFVFPVLLIATGPVAFLYDRSKVFGLIVMVFFIITGFWLLNFLWKKGLDQYHSASS